MIAWIVLTIGLVLTIGGLAMTFMGSLAHGMWAPTSLPILRELWPCLAVFGVGVSMMAGAIYSLAW